MTRTPPRLLPRLLIALAALAVVLIAGSLLHDSALDHPVVAGLNHLHVGAFASLTTAAYFLLDPPGAILITALIALTIVVVGLIRHHGARRTLLTAAAYAVTVAVTWLPITAFKALFSRPRPDFDDLPHPFVEPQGDNSIPSGHTAFAVVTVVALYLLVASTHRARVLTVVLGSCGIALVILVVISNGVHFPTDSAASLIWGLCVTPLVAALCQHGIAVVCTSHV